MDSVSLGCQNLAVEIVTHDAFLYGIFYTLLLIVVVKVTFAPSDDVWGGSEPQEGGVRGRTFTLTQGHRRLIKEASHRWKVTPPSLPSLKPHFHSFNFFFSDWLKTAKRSKYFTKVSAGASYWVHEK